MQQQQLGHMNLLFQRYPQDRRLCPTCDHNHPMAIVQDMVQVMDPICTLICTILLMDLDVVLGVIDTEVLGDTVSVISNVKALMDLDMALMDQAMAVTNLDTEAVTEWDMELDMVLIVLMAQDLPRRDIEDKNLSLDHLSLGIPAYDTYTGLFLIHDIHS